MRKWLIAAAVAAAAAPLLSACGGSDVEGEHTIVPVGNPTDRAFVDGMVPHHRAAIQMAEIAQDQGQSEFVKALAGNIIRTQNAEIDSMEDVDADLRGASVQIGNLGLSESAMGMHGDMSQLESANRFDRMFMEMMIPHHQGAIRMAKLELERGENPELKHLAQRIIEAQSREIAEMRAELAGGSADASGTDSGSIGEMHEMNGSTGSGQHSMDEIGH